MKIVELLKPKEFKDNSLLSKDEALHELDVLRKRISGYSDKLKSNKLKPRERNFYQKNLNNDLKTVKDISENLTEAIHTIPLSNSEFEELKLRLNNPVPAEIASVILDGILVTDDLDAEFQAAAKQDPNHDCRSIIINWLNLYMPDQMSKFTRCI